MILRELRAMGEQMGAFGSADGCFGRADRANEDSNYYDVRTERATYNDPSLTSLFMQQ